MSHDRDLTSAPRRPLLLVLGALVALGPLTIDLYLPAFPAIRDALGASPAAVQLTLTATTIGLALGQLVVGPWADTVGRRLPLLVATAVHVAASLGVAFAPDITWVLVCRFLQGAGSAGGAVVAMAVVRDAYTGRPFVLALARLALVTGLAPVIAPTVGAQLLRLLDWRGLFACVAAYGVLALVLAALVLPETLPPHRRGGTSVREVLRRQRHVLGDRAFIGVALIGGMMVSGVFAFVTSSSFLLQDVHHLDANGYGLVFAANATAFVLGTQGAARLVARFSATVVLGWCLPLLAGAGFLVALLDGGGLGLLVACTVAFHVGAGACGPCLSVIGLAHHGEQAGTAASLLGVANFGLAGLIAPVVGAVGVDSAVPVGVAMGLCGTVAFTLFLTLVRPGAAGESAAVQGRPTVDDGASRP